MKSFFFTAIAAAMSVVIPLFLMIFFLTGCQSFGSASDSDISPTQQSTISSDKNDSSSVTEQSHTELASESEQSVQTTQDETSETNETRYMFTPVLTEDDIEYQGIPYKMLTPEQVLMLWSQCNAQRNYQVLYVIHKGRNESNIADSLKTDATGNYIICYQNLKVNKIDTLDFIYNDEADLLYYSLLYDMYSYRAGEKAREEKDQSCFVRMIKEDGVWKIDSTFTGPPPQVDDVTDSIIN